MKKLFLILVAGIILGGCTLASWREEAASDEQSQAAPSATTTGQADTDLAKTPSLTSDNQVGDLETDINNTEVLNEDFADLDL